MQWNRRRERGTDTFAIERPPVEQCLASLDARLVGRCRQLARLVAHRLGHRLQQAGQRLVECAVRHHRRHDRAHADVVVGARHRVHAVLGGQRQFDGQVVAGRASLAHHLDGRNQRAQVFVVDAAAAVEGCTRREKHFQRHPVLDLALGQAAMRMRVRIDEARHQQPVGWMMATASAGAARPGCADLSIVPPRNRMSAASIRWLDQSSNWPPRITVVRSSLRQLPRRLPARHVQPDRLHIGGAARRLVDDRALEHHADAVGKLEQFIQVLAEQQDGGARVARIHDLRADLAGGGEVEPEAGFCAISTVPRPRVRAPAPCAARCRPRACRCAHPGWPCGCRNAR